MKQGTSKGHSYRIIHLEIETLEQRKAPFAQCRLLRQRKRGQVIAFIFGSHTQVRASSSRERRAPPRDRLRTLSQARSKRTDCAPQRVMWMSSSLLMRGTKKTSA